MSREIDMWVHMTFGVDPQKFRSKGHGEGHRREEGGVLQLAPNRASKTMGEVASGPQPSAPPGPSGPGPVPPTAPAPPSNARPAFSPPPQSRQPTLRKGDKSPDGWVEYLQELLKIKVTGQF